MYFCTVNVNSREVTCTCINSARWQQASKFTIRCSGLISSWDAWTHDHCYYYITTCAARVSLSHCAVCVCVCVCVRACMRACMCVCLASDSSETIKVMVTKFGTVTVSDMIIYHVLIILALTFIQGHTYIILNGRLFQNVFKQCRSRLLWR